MEKTRITVEQRENGYVGVDPDGEVYVFSKQPRIDLEPGVYFDADYVVFGGYRFILNLRHTFDS